jgi:hypothetical protein
MECIETSQEIAEQAFFNPSAILPINYSNLSIYTSFEWSCESNYAKIIYAPFD